jgi:hypothetical protein
MRQVSGMVAAYLASSQLTTAMRANAPIPTEMVATLRVHEAFRK